MNKGTTPSWKAGLSVIDALHSAGYVAYFAGGCVRDTLLSITPKDYDVATNATPDQVIQVFPRARKVGAKFGVILVRTKGFDIEVATFRKDGTYTDGRRPDEVTFGNEADDVERRDFTINALFYDPLDDRVIDYVRGRQDLREGIIRTVGDPVERFTEDHLRMLRAIRFAARLGFSIDDDTWDAMCKHADRLTAISPERVWMELESMLVAQSRVAAWHLLLESGLINHLEGSLSWGLKPTDWESGSRESLVTARLAALPNKPVPVQLSWACVVADLPVGDLPRIAQTLRLSNRVSDATTWMIESTNRITDANDLELADLKILMAHEEWPNLLELIRADLTARDATLEKHEILTTRASAVDPQRVTPPPLLDGFGLQELGLPTGRLFGTIIKAVYRAQLNEAIETVEQAQELAREMISAASD